VVDLSDRQIGADIVAACRPGDRDAFRALYDFYKVRVYSIALYFSSCTTREVDLNTTGSDAASAGSCCGAARRTACRRSAAIAARRYILL
jgi:hypothetical protein